MNSRTAVALAFAATMALAGFLLFQVQLVLGKFILPWFGGSASTWLVCLLFFQVALLAGLCARLCHHAAVADPPSGAGADRPSWPEPAAAADHALRELEAAGCERSRRGASWVCSPCASACPISRLPQRRRCCRAGLRTSSLDSIRCVSSPPRISARSWPAVLSVRLRAAAAEREQTRWWSWAYVLYAALFAACGFLTISRARGAKGPMRAALRTGTRRPAPGVDCLSGARLGPAARHDQRHHPMVRGRAVPVGGSAQRLSPDLRDRLRLSSALSP